MKRLAAIILSALLLFSFTACDFSNYDSSVEESTADEIGSDVADFSSYEGIIKTFKAIVNCFSFYTEEEYLKNEFASIIDFPSLESEEIYKKLFFSAYYHYKADYADEYLSDGRNYFGYAIYDINKNGSDELILLNDHYNIIAIFTNHNGNPQLVIDNQPECRIDSNGHIYTQEYVDKVNEHFPSFDFYYVIKVHTLNEHDEISVDEEYQAINPHNPEYRFYLDTTHGEEIEINHEEFTSKTHGCLHRDEAAIITKSSLDFNFVRLLSPLNPYLPQINSWQWSTYEHAARRISISNLTDESVTIGFLLSNGPYVTAIRDGEKAYFETETISGYLEFGLDCIWIVITESQVDEFPCGAYIYQHYIVTKG